MIIFLCIIGFVLMSYGVVVISHDVLSRKDLLEARAHRDECERQYQNKINELGIEVDARLKAETQNDELLAALKSLNVWIVAEAEHFGANMPDDFIMDMVNKALAITE